jgi:hypothetical protein
MDGLVLSRCQPHGTVPKDILPFGRPRGDQKCRPNTWSQELTRAHVVDGIAASRPIRPTVAPGGRR